jgi:hypothetical protein
MEGLDHPRNVSVDECSYERSEPGCKCDGIEDVKPSRIKVARLLDELQGADD